jgi:hypothetical protein
MLEDKAMIIIAVSRYAGTYDNLPGAITSARRLREWAEQSEEDCHYKVLYLADDVYEKIDLELLSKEITKFIEHNFIDRLIVYFAGHGIVRSASEQFWLLTDAATDLTQGINVEAFRRGLLKYNIGTSNQEIPGQLCIISDACRNTDRDAIDFYGHPILTSTAERDDSIEVDKFLSTGLGDYSFQINEVDDESAYCLFSEVLLGALHGEVKEAVEAEDHKFKPVVTNSKLKKYLINEVKERAASIEETMKPDIITGISYPYNFYKQLKEGPLDITGSPRDHQITDAIKMAIHNSDNDSNHIQPSSPQLLLREALLLGKERIEQHAVTSSIYSTICDFPPKSIAVPRDAFARFDRFHGLYHIGSTDSYGKPILICQNDRWLITPVYPNVTTIIFQDLPGDLLFYKHRRREWDTYLSDFSNLAGSAPLRASEAQIFADKIRVGKEEFPHQAVTAGYLYEFSNDYANVARTAHYMDKNIRIVPFDLALLCADRIWWSTTKEGTMAYADLPAVKSLKTVENDDYRPYYARAEFDARKNVRLWGIAPIFSQGWSFTQTELYLKLPENIRQIGQNTGGKSAASLTQNGLQIFLEAFDYKILEVKAE